MLKYLLFSLMYVVFLHKSAFSCSDNSMNSGMDPGLSEIKGLLAPYACAHSHLGSATGTWLVTVYVTFGGTFWLMTNTFEAILKFLLFAIFSKGLL